MPEQLGRLSHWPVRFDAEGDVDEPQRDRLLDELPAAGLTDLFVFSHGWNNDPATAAGLYERFFALVEALVGRDAGSRIGVVGVLWPSMAWLDEPIPDFPVAEGGAAALAVGPDADADPVAALKAVFTEPEQQRRLDELAHLLDVRPEDPARLVEFHELLRALVAADAAGDDAPEDSGEIAMLTEEPTELYGRFLAAEDVLLAGGGAGDEPAARLADAGPLAVDAGGAAGLGDVPGRLWSGARTALRQATYFVMKRRAGTVGERGLGPLVAAVHRVAPQVRVHLIGHSFGARLVSFALAGLPGGAAPSPVKSLVLLQGAFSHFAFAARLPYDPGRGGALSGRAAAVDGPLVCCFSAHDSAVGVLYPLASFGSRSDAAARPELAVRWGAMGHDGAQAVDAGQVDVRPVGTPYPYQPGRFLNVDASAVVRRGRPLSGAHSDIFHPELAWIAVSAAGLISPAAGAEVPAII